MKNTITMVYPQPRAWGDKFPDNCSVMVQFADGSQGDIGTKKDKADTHIELLSKLLLKETEFEVDGDPREFQGVRIWKIKNYEGKPQGGAQGGGGGRQYTPRYTDTAEGFRAEQTAMNARTALMKAADRMPEDAFEEVIAVASAFFAWLQYQTVSDAPKPAEPPATRSNGQNATQTAQRPATDVPAAKAGQEYRYAEDLEAQAQRDADADHHADPRKRFFALWHELNLPDNDEYSRYVIQRILVKVKAWPEDVPIESRTELGEALWGIAVGGLKGYSTLLVRKGIKPMQEEGFQQEQVAEI